MADGGDASIWGSGLVAVPGPKGDPGPAGPATDLTIGSVTNGLTAKATITGVAPNLVLNLELPQGQQGAKGLPGVGIQLSIGTVTEGATASATLTGVFPNQQLNLVLPKGSQGPAGTPGIDGASLLTELLDVASVVPIEVLPGYVLAVDADKTGFIWVPAGGSTSAAAVVSVAVDTTLASAYESKFIRVTSASPVSITVPAALTTIDAYAEFHIRQAGAGLVTIVADIGVTINPPFGGTLILAGQGAVVTLKKIATDVYDLFGVTEAA
jgi:hypothetical protein